MTYNSTLLRLLDERNKRIEDLVAEIARRQESR